MASKNACEKIRIVNKMWLKINGITCAGEAGTEIV